MSGYDVCKHGRIRCAECAYVEELEDRIEELEQQNKRYREALEEILKIQENHEWNLYGLAYGIAERILFDLEESE